MELLATTPSVKDVKILNVCGPWNTKSDGKLMSILSLSFATLQSRYFNYKPKELAVSTTDIRGLRIYTVRDLSRGKIGGREWHRIREEIVFVPHGSVQWTCEDLQGNKKKFTLDSKSGLWMPPFILHTYLVQENRTELLVLANTLFVPENPNTHDTYSAEKFYELGRK